MDLYPVVLEWLSMMVRWLHVVAAVAWIGTSFYFMQTDMKLQSSPELPDGVQGEAWQVHGGNFWNMVKYTVAPKRMPSTFTWYLWDSRVTWLSGFALLILVYYLQADMFLIDKSVMDLSPWQAALFSFLSLAAVWFVYDGLCRSRLGNHDVLLAVIVYVFLVVLAFAFTHVLSGRAAVNQVGAVVGTFMVANAFFVIHPNQRKTVRALRSGASPDPNLVKKARQRSIHNNYLTLPVVLLMISNHYPLLYATKYNWVIVAIILALGPVIRHYFNSRHAGKGSPWWTWVVAAIGMVLVLFLSAQGPAHAEEAPRSLIELVDGASTDAVPNIAAVQAIIGTRCLMCHTTRFSWGRFAHPGGNVSFDGVSEIQRYAGLIETNAVLSNAMPPGNFTGMTAAERRQLMAWIKAEKSKDE
ncbi:urate hydroxylase PuuD [Pusillimonas noertemannii]|uniref:urate hydroxylase PuuD n=1 Tax=Pusillimonas noertemannii TaxID=305977 RepID=UPI0002DDBC8F|nr:urate hydroxylase PuuD [Pusillimonas noertemannii]